MEPARKILEEIRSGHIKNNSQLELAKISMAGGLPLVKNSQISELISPADKDYSEIKNLLKTKNIRTASGVANISVMWLHDRHENSCPFQCIYCPTAKDSDRMTAPKSYIGTEPATLRAIRNGFDPLKQVSNRLRQLKLIGHPTDKCELIIMGGTFMATPKKFQESFVKGCFDAFNGRASESLEQAYLMNESAENRCIGLTIETRADYCTQDQIEHMLRLGCTRVEIGVQTTDDLLLNKINRGHGTQANIDAIKRLKENGLKVCVHWMPGLTGLSGKIDEQKEIELFRQMFTSDYMPDEIKIYPTLVIPGTKLHELWEEGKYIPLSGEQMIGLLIEFKKIIPKFVRIKRVMRDISEHKAEAGAKTTNLRQLTAIRMEQLGMKCSCIRCREAGHVNKIEGPAGLKRYEYDASGGREIFLSYESGNALFAFLRLRLEKTAAVRELHVYGNVVPISARDENRCVKEAHNGFAFQHTGFGKSLLMEAEEIAKENGYSKIAVTSGVGARQYYENLGYSFKAPYMEKNLPA